MYLAVAAEEAAVVHRQEGEAAAAVLIPLAAAVAEAGEGRPLLPRAGAPGALSSSPAPPAPLVLRAIHRLRRPPGKTYFNFQTHFKDR